MRSLGALAAAALAALAPAGAQTDLPGAEGPLRNGAFLPRSDAAAEQLAAGDAQAARLAAAGWPAATPADERAWTALLESWHQAAALAEPGRGVEPRPEGPEGPIELSWPDPDGTATHAPPRRSEAVAVGVLRRLGTLPEGGRRRWIERFEPLAAESLDAAGTRPAALGELGRLHPATPSAFRAELRLAEIAIEEGRGALAEGRLRRAREHLARLPDAPPELARALEARAGLVAGLRPEPAPDPSPAWSAATRLVPITRFGLEDLKNRRRFQLPRPGSGIQPGIAFLDDGSAVIQASDAIVLAEPEGGRRVGSFDPDQLLDRDAFPIGEARVGSTAPPGWALLPQGAGRTLVFVHGRVGPAGSGAGRFGEHPNALFCVEVQPSGAEDTGPFLPRLTWAIRGDQRIDSAGAVTDGAVGVEGEFQPGPLLVGSTVVALVRERSTEAEGDVRSHVVAFDARTGERRWRVEVGKGLDVDGAPGRFSPFSAAPGAGQPLALANGHVFCGTHTGTGTLLDLVDGRLAWTLKTRRRAPEDAGWTGARPPVVQDPPTVVFAPADSDRAYWLRAEPVLDGAGLMRHPPTSNEGADALVGAEGSTAFVFARTGRHRALAARDAHTGRRTSAPYLGPGEVFTGPAWIGRAAAVCASDRGVYLYDRRRELFLVDYARMESERAPAGGRVAVHGDRVWIVGPHAVWVYEAR